MQNKSVTLWKNCLLLIKDTVSNSDYEKWFKPINIYSYEDDTLKLSVPTQFFYEYIEENFIHILKLSIARVFGQNTQLKYKIGVTKDTIVEYGSDSSMPAHTAKQSYSKAKPVENSIAKDPFQHPKPQVVNSQLNPNYRFENYVEGVSNRLGRAAGDQIAHNPGKTTYNPLFVYGPSGVGKTHLCNAIGMRIRELYPEKRVIYVSSHLFRMQFTEAIRKNCSNDFIYFYQNIDVLIIDDIQEMVGKEKTQNMFFHIFNHLHHLGKQLIMTSDKPPVELEGMAERMLTRLKWGLTAPLDRPDFELRKQILHNMLVANDVKLPEEVFDYIAVNVKDNVRDLEGIVISLQANSLINNQEISLSLARRIVAQSVRIEKKKSVTIESIAKIVCEYYNVEEKLIQTATRKHEIAFARQVAMFLSKKHTGSSLSQIGTSIGKRNHATVVHACNTIKTQIEVNKTIKKQIEEIEKKLQF